MHILMRGEVVVARVLHNDNSKTQYCTQANQSWCESPQHYYSHAVGYNVTE